PRLEYWATAALGLALNGLTAAAWPAVALGSLVAAAGRVDVTLGQMVPGSGFLNNLASSTDPGVRYTIVTGDTAVKPAALLPQQERGGTSIVQRLLSRLSVNDAMRHIADQVFSAPNDIAVAVASMTAIGRARSPRVAVLPAACDHMSYFRN